MIKSVIYRFDNENSSDILIRRDINDCVNIILGLGGVNDQTDPNSAKALRALMNGDFTSEQAALGVYAVRRAAHAKIARHDRGSEFSRGVIAQTKMALDRFDLAIGDLTIQMRDARPHTGVEPKK